MLELVSQRGFRERDQQPVSGPANPGNLDGAGFFDPMGRRGGLSERSEPAPGTELVPRISGAQDTGMPRGCRLAHRRIPAIAADAVVLRRTHNSLMEKRLSPTTLLGQEPENFLA